MEIIATETSFTDHELDEWYPGLITDAGEGDDYGFGPTFKISVLLDGEESDTWALCSPTLTPQTKLWRWLQAIDASLLPEFGGIFQYEKLVGRRVEIMFEQGKTRVNVGKIRAEKPKGVRVEKAKPNTIRGNQVRAAAAKNVEYAPGEEPF